jgi:hypothetical protein
VQLIPIFAKKFLAPLTVRIGQAEKSVRSNNGKKAAG